MARRLDSLMTFLQTNQFDSGFLKMGTKEVARKGLTNESRSYQRHLLARVIIWRKRSNGILGLSPWGGFVFRDQSHLFLPFCSLEFLAPKVLATVFQYGS